MMFSDRHLAYEVHGPADAPVVIMSSGLGGAGSYWAPQLPAMTDAFRVITYDHLGTGRSPGRLPDGYAIADMAHEVVDLLDTLGVTRCAFVGHALGGLIGLQLALDHPGRVERLVLVNAWLKTHPHTVRCFDVRLDLLRHTGVAAFVRAQPLFLYPADWLASRQDWLTAQDAHGIEHFQGVETVMQRIGAIAGFDLTDRASAITARTCIIAARDDLLVPSSCSMAMAEMLPEASLTLLDHGGHACNVTDPDGFNAVLLRFLRS